MHCLEVPDHGNTLTGRPRAATVDLTRRLPPSSPVPRPRQAPDNPPEFELPPSLDTYGCYMPETLGRKKNRHAVGKTMANGADGTRPAAAYDMQGDDEPFSFALSSSAPADPKGFALNHWVKSQARQRLPEMGEPEDDDGSSYRSDSDSASDVDFCMAVEVDDDGEAPLEFDDDDDTTATDITKTGTTQSKKVKPGVPSSYHAPSRHGRSRVSASDRHTTFASKPPFSTSPLLTHCLDSMRQRQSPLVPSPAKLPSLAELTH